MSDRAWVATRKGVFAVERLGPAGKWRIGRSAFLGDNASMVFPDARDGSVYAALGHGHFGVKVHVSRDEGKTWSEGAVPVYPEQPKELPPPPFEGKTAAPWSLELLWCLEAGGKDEPGVIWAGTIPGGLFRSADRGASWSLVRSLWDEPTRPQWFGGGYDHPGIHSICVDPRDSKRVLVGVSCGGAWGTPDGGASWQCRATGMFAAYMPPERAYDPQIQDPHRVAQCAAQPECLWTQHHNGVFRTTDGGKNWREVKDPAVSNFGFAVAVHPRDPEVAWLAPAIKDERRIPVEGRVVVTRTRDGGKSFDVLREGLPGPDAYDLVYRHGLDVDETGERLLLGSTTGSLWVSEDQGDRWTCVSAHLPPIYCARFEN